MSTQKDWGLIGPVAVRIAGGRSGVFATLEEAVAWAGWSRVAAYRDNVPFVEDPVWYQLDYRVLREPVRVLFVDELGMRIPAWRVMEAAHSVNLEELSRFRWRWGIKYDPSTFRRAPVPGVRSHWGGGRLRHPFTTQERRAAEAADRDEEFREAGGRVRGRRNAVNLPDYRCDIIRSRRGRSWKAHRRTRWKE